MLRSLHFLPRRGGPRPRHRDSSGVPLEFTAEGWSKGADTYDRVFTPKFKEYAKEALKVVDLDLKSGPGQLPPVILDVGELIGCLLFGQSLGKTIHSC